MAGMSFFILSDLLSTPQEMLRIVANAWGGHSDSWVTDLAKICAILVSSGNHLIGFYTRCLALQSLLSTIFIACKNANVTRVYANACSIDKLPLI